MAHKTVVLPDIGEVKLTKRRGAKHLRLRVAHTGELIVSMPPWVPYYAGRAFAEKNAGWIKKHARSKPSFADGQALARQHRMVFHGTEKLRPSSRLAGNELRIFIPDMMTPDSAAVKAAVQAGIKKAYRAEGPYLLARLQRIAAEHSISYAEGRLKFMTSRWGSCKNDGTITLNYRLLDMPDNIIDYVIVHELAHTRHHNHSAAFWDVVGQLMPDYKDHRRALKKSNLLW